MARRKFGSDDFDGVGAEGGDFSNSPPKPGSYVGKLKRVVVGTIQNGDNKGADRLRTAVEITGPKTAKRVDGSSAIGAWVWGGLNVTEQGAGYVNQFLHALTGAKTDADKTKAEKAFWGKGKFDGAEVDDNDNVVKIGKDIFIGSPDGEKLIGIVTKLVPDRSKNASEGDKTADIARYLAAKSGASDEDDDEDEDDDDKDMDDDTDDDDDDSDDEDNSDDESDEDDDEDEDEDDDDESSEREAELAEMSLVALKKEAKAAGVAASDLKGASKEDIIEMILDAEESDEDEEDEDDEDADDERLEELKALSLVKLKAEAKKAGLSASDIKGLDKDDLIEAILESEPPF